MRLTLFLLALAAIACSSSTAPGRADSLEIARAEGLSCRMTLAIYDSMDHLTYYLSLTQRPCPTSAELDSLYGAGRWTVKILH